ncbi:MAG: hypothetical protein JJT88_12695 [Gammaproteobacteria bacterium]|nr:hypothetical protein [Gammaproteobacteria bacterium]
MTLARSRSFTTARPGEDWPDIARRALPDLDTESALEGLKSWNLHLFLRQPGGRILGSDVIFTEAPLVDASVHG